MLLARSLPLGCKWKSKFGGLSVSELRRNRELSRDRSVAEALSALADSKPGLGFWELFNRLRRMGHDWNHKRVYRVYCLLKLNLRRCSKKLCSGAQSIATVRAGGAELRVVGRLHE